MFANTQQTAADLKTLAGLADLIEYVAGDPKAVKQNLAKMAEYVDTVVKATDEAREFAKQAEAAKANIDSRENIVATMEKQLAAKTAAFNEAQAVAKAEAAEADDRLKALSASLEGDRQAIDKAKAETAEALTAAKAKLEEVTAKEAQLDAKLIELQIKLDTLRAAVA